MNTGEKKQDNRLDSRNMGKQAGRQASEQANINFATSRGAVVLLVALGGSRKRKDHLINALS